MEKITVQNKVPTTLVATISHEEKEKIIELFTFILRNSKEETAFAFLELVALVINSCCIETYENNIGGQER